MFRRFLFILTVCVFLLGMATKAEVESVKESNMNDRNPGSDKYVKKVIIDAEWGDGPGEFGVDVDKVNPGPRNLIVDGENLYIYDWANYRIYKYDVKGNFKKTLNVSKDEMIVNFTVQKDTLYGVLFPGLSKVEKIKLIDTKTNKEIKMLEIKLPESHSILNIYKSNGKIVVARGAGDEKERYSLGGVLKEGETVTVSVNKIPPKASERFRKIDKTEGELVVDGRKFLISKVRGSSLYNARKIAEDRDGDIYIKVWSESLENSVYSDFEQIFKYSITGRLLADFLLPRDKMISGGLVVKSNGDIFYLYCTGEIIVKDWKKKFIPGKVQVIKWELQG